MPLMIPVVAVCDGEGCNSVTPATVVRDAQDPMARLNPVHPEETVIFGVKLIAATYPGDTHGVELPEADSGWKVLLDGRILCPTCVAKGPRA